MLLGTAAPDAEQQQDLDFMLNVGQLFSLIVYGQLILEQAALTGVDDDIVDQIFDFQIRDFDLYAIALHGKPTSTQAQQDWAAGAIRKPMPDAERFTRVWERVKEELRAALNALDEGELDVQKLKTSLNDLVAAVGQLHDRVKRIEDERAAERRSIPR